MLWIKFTCSSNTWLLFKYMKYSKSSNFEKYRFCSILSNTVITKKDVSSSSLKPKYDTKETESSWYEWWESKNYFKAKESSEDPFVVLLPPPNITGNLHLGHTLTITLQDVILRWKRMKGESVLWIPALDHAGIATQVVIEKRLKQQFNLSRHDLGREKFLNEIWKWKDTKEDEIINQLRKLGASLDWTKLKFTLDPDHNKLVNKSFIELYNQGLIYRSKRLINWSCALKTSISDIEVEWIDINKTRSLNVPGYKKPITFGFLYKFAYKLIGEDDEIVVATTRPETMLGDVAVAVNPNDHRFSKFKNKKVWHPFRKEAIPVIFDEFVDMNFGTGAVKITPAHSLDDFEVSLRHNLKAIPVIDESGCICEINSAEDFKGLKRFDARFAIIGNLKKLNLYREQEHHQMQLPICSRSGDVVEFISKDQWYLKCESAAKMAVEAVDSGQLNLYPSFHNECWYEWLKNIRDWNLSRQLWWGHQIPMYECSYKNEKIWIPAFSLEEAKKTAAEKFNNKSEISVVRDPDVLDTWFSSGLLPLGLPFKSGNTPPISLLITGHDILFFWVARMVLLSLLLTGKLPFNNVVLHALVCDGHGKKMSKSSGNVIQPENIINGCSLNNLNSDLKVSFEEGLLTKAELKKALAGQKSMFPQGIPLCGVDALRMNLCSYNYKGQFLNFDPLLCQGTRFFGNKIWQAMNYYIKVCNLYSENNKLALVKINKKDLNMFDMWILGKLYVTITTVNENMEKYNFSKATSSIRSFVVNDFCSYYLESTKKSLEHATAQQVNTIVTVLHHCLECSLRLLSPFMPFLSEHLYHALPLIEGFEKCESITIAEYPKAIDWDEFVDAETIRKFQILVDFTSECRKITALFNLKLPEAFIECSEDADFMFSEEVKNVVIHLFKVADVKKVSKVSPTNLIQQKIEGAGTIYVSHPYDVETLNEMFGKILSEKKDIEKKLSKLLMENKADSKTVHLKHMNNLRKIELVKKVIENCDRVQ